MKLGILALQINPALSTLLPEVLQGLEALDKTARAKQQKTTFYSTCTSLIRMEAVQNQPPFYAGKVLLTHII